MFRAEHPYERAEHLADSLARRAVAVRRVFSQLPLLRFDDGARVAFTVVCAPLAAYMLAGKVVVCVNLLLSSDYVPLSPNPPKDTDGRREESGRGVRELQGK